ncbi:MAG TPA: hypothetical protein VD769_09325 [Gaiellaceae bacterium]|nr:hypothetical protein [Gaiellaceae bacterium]
MLALGCALALSGCGGADVPLAGQRADPPCDLGDPPVDVGGAGDVEPLSERPLVAFARGDASVTLVGLCRVGGELPEQLPELETPRGRLIAAGGSLVQGAGGWGNYLIFPPVGPGPVRVVDRGAALAQIRFPPAPASPCPREGASALSLVACGAFFVIEWQTSLPHRPENVEIVDVDTADGGPGGAPLGFYLYGLDRTTRGLRIRFAVSRPESNRLHLNVREITLANGAIESGPRAVLRLRPPTR